MLQARNVHEGAVSGSRALRPDTTQGLKDPCSLPGSTMCPLLFLSVLLCEAWVWGQRNLKDPQRP